MEKSLRITIKQEKEWAAQFEGRKSTSIHKQIMAFKEGRILDYDGVSSEAFNFEDWYCKDTSLVNKSKKLFKQLKQFLKYKKVSLKNNYVVFNNDKMYDSFSIHNRTTHNEVYRIVPHYPATNKAELYNSSDSFAVKKANSYSELLTQI